MPGFFKRKELWGSIIALVLLAYILYDVGLQDLRSVSKKANFYYMIPALLAQFAVAIIKSIRWRTIVHKTQVLKFSLAIPLWSAGQVINFALPALTGQVGRVLLFSKNTGLKKSFVFSTLLLELMFDAIVLIILVIIASMAFAFPSEYRSVSYIIAGITLVGFILLYLLLQYRDRLEAIGERTIKKRRPGLYIALKKFARSFSRGISLLQSTNYCIKTFLLSAAAWICHLLVVYFIFMSFGFDLPFIVALAVLVINTIAVLIPITPLNAGTFEIAVIAPLIAFGIPKSEAALYSISLHLINFIPIFILGWFFLRADKDALEEIKKEGKGELLDEVTDDEDEEDSSEEITVGKGRT